MTLWDILLSAALQHVRANGQHAIHPKARRFSRNDRLRNVSLGVGAHLERIRAEEKNEETGTGKPQNHHGWHPRFLTLFCLQSVLPVNP